MTTKELMSELAEKLKKWQRIEDASATSTSEVLQKTDHPLIRMVMEIIHADSKMHRRVQQLVIDQLERESVAMSPDDLAEVWTHIEMHIELEKKMIGSVREALEAVKGKKMLQQEYLLKYLLTDEQKHDMMLEHLELIKRDMYPYAS